MAEVSETFEKDVILPSMQGPVVVDFWAAWCGPCRALGPVLEKLAEEAGEAWRLVKVDVDAEPEAAQAYGVRGIPAVKMFHKGDVVAEFTGALPEPQVRQWLADHLPSAGREALERALALIGDGKAKEAIPVLEGVVSVEPGLMEARSALGRLILFEAPERAGALVDGIRQGDPGAAEADAVRTLSKLLEKDPAKGEGPGWETYLAGVDALRRHDFDGALDRWIETIASGHRAVDEDGPRRACIALFQVLGDGHLATKKHRRAFSSALF